MFMRAPVCVCVCIIIIYRVVCTSHFPPAALGGRGSFMRIEIHRQVIDFECFIGRPQSHSDTDPRSPRPHAQAWRATINSQICDS